MTIVGIIRAFLFALTCVAYFLVTFPFQLIYKWAPFFSRKCLSHILSYFCRFALFFMGIKVDLKNYNKAVKNQNHLVVCNHMSYLDILVLSAHFPGCFVTSVEIKNMAGLGHLCRLAACLFVERRSKKNLKGEVKEITDTLYSGTNVIIFPEATSTNGTQILRFKRPLFNAAISSLTPVLPLTLNYTSIAGQEFSVNNRDTVCWYGEMTFLDHIWKVFKTPYIKAELTLESLILTRFSMEATDLAALSQQKVEQHFCPVIA